MSKLGLALGGGGARGLAHIGVLKVLEKENIRIDVISGCSMGSVVGALYSYFQNAEKLESFFINFIDNIDFEELGINELNEKTNRTTGLLDNISKYLKIRYNLYKSLNRLSFFTDEIAEKIFSSLPDIEIENLKIKFSAIATDLITGEEINLTNGSLREVVRASSAIPAIFPPVKIKDMLLVDGGATESVPVEIVRKIGADRVLAIDVTRCLQTTKEPQNLFDILFRTEDISTFHLSKLRLESADLIIRPKVKHLDWSEFLKVKEIIAAGEEITKKMLPEIKKLVDKNYYLLSMEHYIKKLKQ
jgi:NTE family protein